MGSSQNKDQNHVTCIGRGFLSTVPTREVHCPIFCWAIYHIYGWVVRGFFFSFFNILDSRLVSGVWFAILFSQSVGCLSTFLIVSFDIQKLSFWWSPTYFFFVACAFWCHLTASLGSSSCFSLSSDHPNLILSHSLEGPWPQANKLKICFFWEHTWYVRYSVMVWEVMRPDRITMSVERL